MEVCLVGKLITGKKISRKDEESAMSSVMDLRPIFCCISVSGVDK